MTMNTSDQWELLKAGVYRICHSFHRTTGIDLDELKAEGRVAFTIACRRWDPKRPGCLNTLVNAVVKNRLRDVAQKNGNRRRLLPEEPFDEATLCSGLPFCTQEFIEGLSADARTVVALTLKSPEEVSLLYDRRFGLRRGMRAALREYLTVGLDWDPQRVRDSFEEIGDALNEAQ